MVAASHISFFLSSTEPISNVKVEKNQTDQTEFDSSVVIKCSVSSGFSPSFRWLNDSSEVTANDRVRLTDRNTTLTIFNLTRYDDGPFMCFAFNAVSNRTSRPVKVNTICKYRTKVIIYILLLKVLCTMLFRIVLFFCFISSSVLVPRPYLTTRSCTICILRKYRPNIH